MMMSLYSVQRLHDRMYNDAVNPSICLQGLRKTFLTTDGVLAEIRSEHLPSAKRHCYLLGGGDCYATVLGTVMLYCWHYCIAHRWNFRRMG
jgi:hypothetical protein